MKQLGRAAVIALFASVWFAAGYVANSSRPTVLYCEPIVVVESGTSTRVWFDWSGREENIANGQRAALGLPPQCFSGPR